MNWGRVGVVPVWQTCWHYKEQYTKYSYPIGYKWDFFFQGENKPLEWGQGQLKHWLLTWWYSLGLKFHRYCYWPGSSNWKIHFIDLMHLNQFSVFLKPPLGTSDTAKVRVRNAKNILKPRLYKTMVKWGYIIKKDTRRIGNLKFTYRIVCPRDLEP